MERRLASQFTLLEDQDRHKIERGDYVENEINQIVFGEPILR
jgi:hypothetical protein